MDERPLDWFDRHGYAEPRRQGRDAPRMSEQRLAEVAAVLASGDGRNPPDEVVLDPHWMDLVNKRP